MSDEASFPPYVVFKTEIIANRARYLCKEAKEVMYAMAEYCEEQSLPFLVTDTVSTKWEDEGIDRMSVTHLEGRAFDVSVKKWSDAQISDFIFLFTKTHGNLGALSKASNARRLIVRHNNGHGDHMHVQVARQYATKIPSEMV